MAKTVILEFEDGDEHEADALVESINEYNLGIMIIQSDSGMHRAYPYISGVFKDIIAIEGENLLPPEAK